MPTYQFNGQSQVSMGTSKSGKEYMRRFVYLTQYDSSGVPCASVEKLLAGDTVNAFDGVPIGSKVFVDFDHSGWFVSCNVFPDK